MRSGSTHRSGFAVVAVLHALAAVAAAPPPAAGAAPGVAEVARAEAARRATVYVIVEAGGVGGTGTGFCIDEAGLFVTNDHVVTLMGKAPPGRPPKVTVVFAPNTKAERRLPAAVVRTDPKLDLAVLRVDRPGRLDALDLAPPAAVLRLRETDPVMAPGFPLGAKLSAAGGAAPDVSVSTGKITSLRRVEGRVAQIQFDGSINPGNSGGPLLDGGGQVVGVVYAILLDARQINLAVPVTFVWSILAEANVVLTPPVLRDPRLLAEYADLMASPPPVGRPPVPTGPALAAAQKQARDLFAARYADRSAKARLVLGYDLLERARATTDDPAGRYALLAEARDLAVGAGDVDLAYAAAALVCDRYDVSAVDVMADLVTRVAPRAGKPQDAVLVAAVGLLAAEVAALQDAFADARRLIPIVRTAATNSRNATAVAVVRDRLQRLEAQAGEADRGRAAAAKLAADPNDPDANLAAGRYHCFVRGDFGTGLALLAKGKDAPLKAVAAADLAAANPAAPAAADARKAAGDLWWDQANRETANRAAADRCRERAATWYRLVEPGLTGLAKAGVRERLAAVPPPPATRPTTRPSTRPSGPPADAVLTPTELAGGAGGNPFEDAAPAGGVLVGLVVHTRGGTGPVVVNRLQPVFATAAGGTARGRPWGTVHAGTEHVLVARDGYAVGGLVVRAGDRIDGLAVVFMRRAGDRLDPADAYLSEWVGGPGGVERALAGTGDPVVGLCGRANHWADAVGLIVAKPPRR